MSRNIKSLKKLHSLIGETVHIVGSNGNEFDAVVEDGIKHCTAGKYAVTLVTTDSKADKESYWWQGSTRPLAGVSAKAWGHHVTDHHQLTEELRSVTTFKSKAKTKVKKATKKSFVSADTLKANRGHYCEMSDGSTGFIAGSEFPDNVCVLHNCEDSDGWIISKSYRETEIKGVSKCFIKKFSKGWHVGSDDEAKQVKVVKILDEVSKPKKTKRKESKKSFLTREQLLKHIGKRCKMSDGTEGLIVKTDMDNPRILMRTRSNDHGWPYDGEREGDDTGAAASVKNQYRFAWNVCDNDDAKEISVVKILDDEKSAESSKTILDMTVREVLEKLNEIIISR